MPAINIYLSKEDFLLHEKLPKGEASKLYQQALREYLGSIDSIERIDKKLALLYEDKQEQESRIESLEKRKIKLLEKERQLLQQKADMEAKNKERLAEQLKNVKELFNDIFKERIGRDITEQDIIDYNSPNYQNFKQYMESLDKEVQE